MQDDKPVSDIASAGGKARAEKLSATRKKEIALNAAAARWGLPRARYEGVLNFGDMEIMCSVLEDGSRLIAEQTFMKAMGMYRSGALSVRRRTDEEAGGAKIPLFLAHKNLKPFADKHLGGVHFEPVKHRTIAGNLAHGLRAELVPKVCEIWLDAERAGVLGRRQQMTALKADIILRGLAQVGIIALVDEATGYQDDRDRRALAEILEKFVTKELQPWVSTFPLEFYQEIFRLRGWTFPKLKADQHKRPLLVGRITNDIVYARLAPGVRHELHRKTPRDDKGRLKNALHSWLTPDHGHPKLKMHIAGVIPLMKISDNWPEFLRNINKALPRYKDVPPLLALLDESES